MLTVHPSGPQREPVGLMLMVSPRPLPLLFPFHTTCACLHGWSPGVTSPARRSFTGTKGELERDGLSHVGSTVCVFLLGSPARWEGRPAALLFPVPVPCDLRQAKVLFKQLRWLC